MIDLYFWTSGNAQKVLLFLEEAALDFRVIPVDVSQGAQFAPEFVKIAPNSKIPVIVDHAPADGGAPVTVFESGAILLYLAEKAGRFLSADPRTKLETIQWLFWQMAGLGPMGGQAVHFRNFAPVKIDYAIERYGNEVVRLCGVLDRRLEGRDWIVGDYSIADMACYPWIVAHDRRKQLDFTPFPNLTRWYAAIAARPATLRAYEWIGKVITGPLPKSSADLSPEARRIMFGAHAVPAG